MTTAKERPRARFAPIPIETTFERYRKTIPPGELTPSPSPRALPPPLREKRRFAPQLVESSVRRARRAGDEGPATKYTDKTDITPYTNHIYAPRARKWLGHDEGTESPLSRPRGKGHARRESCDDEIAGGYFDLVARDAQRKMQEAAMSAFPNSGVRIGGAEHFYVREGSDDDSSRGRPLTRGPWNLMQSRRNSSQEDISWAFKEMQEHSQMLNRGRPRDMSRVDTLDLDNMSMDSPPCDAMGLTRTTRTSIVGSPLWRSRPSTDSLEPIGEPHMPLLRAESPLATIGKSTMPYSPPISEPIRAIGETYMPYIPSAPAGKAGDMPYVPASQIPPETSFGHHSPFMPYGQERDPSLERARMQHRRRLKPSPPMLGADLKFRMCPSPKQTKLESDHLWELEQRVTTEEQNRDPTEQHGLWRGFCYTTDQSEKLAPAERPAMITSPLPSASSHDPFAYQFGLCAPASLSEEPTPSDGTTRVGTISTPRRPSASNGSSHLHPPPEHRTRNNQPKGLHMLQNLQTINEKLKKEKALADLEDKIAAEFDDGFVSQVYNYLSLGYPATARQYDEELSKISRIAVEELERDDEATMESLWGGEACVGAERKQVKATGHIMIDSEAKDGVREEDRCPRWKALKLYVLEWARKHPDLTATSPLAWGVAERRGSWGN